MVPDQDGGDQDKYYAMKIINRNQLTKQAPTAEGYLAEFEALKKLDHPFIINLIEVIDDPRSEKLYLVMDLLPGGNLDEKLQDTENGFE